MPSQKTPFQKEKTWTCTASGLVPMDALSYGLSCTCYHLHHHKLNNFPTRSTSDELTSLRHNKSDLYEGFLCHQDGKCHSEDSPKVLWGDMEEKFKALTPVDSASIKRNKISENDAEYLKLEKHYSNGCSEDVSLSRQNDQKASEGVELCLRRVWAVIRIRPPAEEAIPKEDLGISVLGPTALKMFIPQRKRTLSRFSETHMTYHADRILGSAATQQQVWDTIYPALKGIMHLNGCSVTVMAFGATGTGKTYTMLGDDRSLTSFHSSCFFQRNTKSDGHPDNMNQQKHCPSSRVTALERELGVIPRLFDALYFKLEETSELRDIEIYVSSFEIYKEKIIDLFDTTELQPLSSGVMNPKDQRGEKNVYKTSGVVPLQSTKANIFFQRDPSSRSSSLSLRWIHVKTRQDFSKILALGNKRRSKRKTRSNANSSRGHVVWQVNIERCHQNSRLLVGAFQFVDLAGAEQAISMSHSDSTHIHERASINKSLSSLAQCIVHLAKKRQRCRPFRDSKLTRFLAEKFKGKSQLVMIFTTSPFLKHYRSSFVTLQLVRAVLSSSIYKMPPMASYPILLGPSTPQGSTFLNGRITPQDIPLNLQDKNAQETDDQTPSHSIECLHHIIMELWKENTMLRRQLNEMLHPKTLPLQKLLDTKPNRDKKLHETTKDKEVMVCYKSSVSYVPNPSYGSSPMASVKDTSSLKQGQQLGSCWDTSNAPWIFFERSLERQNSSERIKRNKHPRFYTPDLLCLGAISMNRCETSNKNH